LALNDSGYPLILAEPSIQSTQGVNVLHEGFPERKVDKYDGEARILAHPGKILLGKLPPWVQANCRDSLKPVWIVDFNSATPSVAWLLEK
jgi:hypothetical protein